MRQKTIRYLDLFSGIGGFREGLTQAGGFTCVGHFQSDTQLYKQAGNGVTIPVVYAVGKRIVEIQNELEKESL